MDTVTADPAISTAVELLSKGDKLPSILGALVRQPAPLTKVASEKPKTVVITDKIASAVETLGLRTVGHTHLTVAERRPLTQIELDILSAERDAIDALAKYVKARQEAHKIMLYNHWDSEIDASDDDKPALDDDGRYLTKVSTFAQGGSRHFDRQLGEGGPSVTAAALKEVVEDGRVEGFTHDDYLACTAPVRVLDEERTLIHMRTHPATVAALREAAKPGKTSSSFYHRSS